MKKFGMFFLLFLSLALPLASAESSRGILEEIPVQHSGRVKPFQSFAREVAFSVTGQGSWQGISSTELVWSWMASPKEWISKPMIAVPKILQAEFPLMVIHGKISAELVLGHQPFVEKVQEAGRKREEKEKLSAVEQKRMEIYEKALLLQAITQHSMPGLLPHPEDPRIGWLPIGAIQEESSLKDIGQFYPEAKVTAVSASLKKLLELTAAKADEASLVAAAGDFRRTLAALFESQGVFIPESDLGAELLYDRLNPFSLAWKFYLLAAILFWGLMLFEKNAGAMNSLAARIANIASLVSWISGFAVHLTGFVLRCLVAGRPPVTNMYESVIWVSWGVALFSGIFFLIYKARLIGFVSSVVAALALVIAQSFPVVLDPAISPLVPVLRSNMWLTIHVLTITLSYGAFALAWGFGHAVVIHFVKNPVYGEEHRRLLNFLYRTLQIGVILLASGTALGGVWANYSWGRFWGWDPKETWALIALLGYLAVLHGRYAGWLDAFGFAATSVAAFLGIIMAWYGVNYVLAAGLHSYGFGGGGAYYVIGVALADLVLIGALGFLYHSRKNRKPQDLLI